MLVVLAALVGCNGAEPNLQNVGEDEETATSSLLTQTAFDLYPIGWVREDDGSQVVRTSRYIDASPEAVWDFIAHPNQYKNWSTAIHAFVLGTPKAGKTIALSTALFPGLPRVVTFETIGVFDEQHRGVSWYADFGAGGQVVRWQVVVPEGNGSRYYTAEKIPDTGLGSLIHLLTGMQIQTLFETIADELKLEAESLPE